MCALVYASSLVYTAFLTGLIEDLERNPTAEVQPLLRSQVYIYMDMERCMCRSRYVQSNIQEKKNTLICIYILCYVRRLKSTGPDVVYLNA